ncbi:MAG: hypothetical protein GF330_08265 [Candidatus Eisenbacteria bacterium]|nr:hypothetical protein [Candidatus Eisenbacteria bacterium]
MRSAQHPRAARAAAAESPAQPTFAGDLRQLREALLLATEVSGHGGLAATKVIRRVLWLLEAIATQEAASETTRGRLQTTARDFREITRPQIDHILALGAALQLDRAVTEDVSDAACGLSRVLSEMADAEWAPAAIRDHLSQASAVAARIDAGLRRIRVAARRFVTIPVGPEIDSAISAVLEDAERAGVPIDDQVPPEVRTALVRASRGDVAVILENLLANALRAIERGREQSASRTDAQQRISLGGEREEQFVRLEVGDTGCGIAPDDCERIFGRGVSTREGGGTGLYASRELLKNTGGSLRVRQSRPGRTVMELRLMLELDVDSAEPDSSSGVPEDVHAR